MKTEVTRSNSAPPQPPRPRHVPAWAPPPASAGDPRHNTLVKMLRVAILTAVVFLSINAQAQILQSEVLYDFPTAASGVQPNELTVGRDGNLYGTTLLGGASGDGTVFKVTTNGIFTTLASFNGINGSNPTSLTLGNDGVFYGIARGGGNGYGTVFKVTTAGILTRIYSFAETNRGPVGGLALGNDGQFYGTTMGTPGATLAVPSTVFKVTSGGVLTTLAVFTYPDLGTIPWGLTKAGDGNFYGTTYDGTGRIYRITPSGTLTWLQTSLPWGVGLITERLTLGADGYLYGTAIESRSPFWSIVFRLGTDGTFTRLASLPPDFATPPAMILGTDGNFYGGGPAGLSQVLSNGTVTLIAPVVWSTAPTLGPDGNFYWATTYGGSADNGTIVRALNPQTRTNATVIVAQPATQTNIVGSTVHFVSSALGLAPLSYVWLKNGVPLENGENISGARTSILTITSISAVDAAVYQVAVHDGSQLVVPLTFSREASLVVIPNIALPEALDTTNLVWSTGGDARWFGQTDIAYDGTSAARSGFLWDPALVFGRSSSWLETTVAGPATVSFQWKVSSENNYDFLRLLINNASPDYISGEVDWQPRTFVLPPGPQTLRWSYEKDEFQTQGADAAWLDQVQYTPSLVPYILVQPADLSVVGGATAVFTVAATNLAGAPMSYQWFFNGTMPVGDASATLLVPNVGLAQLGGYSVVVSNNYGAVTSRVATLGGGIAGTQQAYVKASNTGPNDQFGTAVSVAGDTMVVGTPGEASNATGVNGNQANNSASEAGAAYILVRDGTNWIQQAYLKASNAKPVARFGSAVAIAGDTAVIGAYQESSTAVGVNGNGSTNSRAYSGAAYVFVRTGTNWIQQAFLKASNPDPNDQFGYAVAIAGDTIVVGANLEASNASGVNGSQTNNLRSGSGAAYVFTRTGTNWTQQAYLKASNPDPGDGFGVSVSIAGGTAVVGANFESSNASGVNGVQINNTAYRSGAAYVFVRDGTNWTQQAYLKASNPLPSAEFGLPVAISGNTIVASARIESSNAIGVNGDPSTNSLPAAGAAYVFVRNGTNWAQQGYLKPSNTRAGCYFGHAVAISGDTVVAAAPLEPSNATGINGNQTNTLADRAGAAYVFVRTGSNWSQQAYLKASNTGAGDQFGWSVGIDDGTAVVGAFWEDSNATGVNGNQTNNTAPESGAAYVFAGLGVPKTPPTISAYERLGNGQFRLRFDSAPSSNFSVLVSTNLTDWTPLGPAAELTPGHFEFTDADAPGHPTRFYQLRTP